MTTLITCWGDCAHDPDEAPATPGWATGLVTQPVEPHGLSWIQPGHFPAHFQCPFLGSPLQVHCSILKLDRDHPESLLTQTAGLPQTH